MKTKDEGPSIDSIFAPSESLELNDGLKLAVYSESKKGKTTLSCSAVCIRNVLKPTYIIDTEGNAKKETKRMPIEQQKMIKVAEVLKFAKASTTNPKDKKRERRIDLVASLDAIDVAIDAITTVVSETPRCEDGTAPGTIIIDSCTDLWKWLGIWLEEGGDGNVKKTASGKMPRFEWGKANKRYMEFIYLLLDSGWHMILTFRSEAVVNDKGEDLKVKKPRMQKDTTYWVDMTIELDKIGDDYSMKFRGDRFGNIPGSIENTGFTGLLDHIEKVSGAKIL
ncbi:MAG: AAA family ATPase [Alphaproteobacteria bacterium]|nr:AAA family ATPase [Alphaproteobacteria bacterium]